MSTESMEQGGAAGAGEAAGPASPLARVAGIFYAPVATFQSLARRFSWADWALPLAIGVLSSLVMFLVLASQFDIAAQMRANLEPTGMSPADIERTVERQVAFMQGPLRFVFMGGQAVVYAVILALLSLLFWGGTSAFGGSITYGKTLAVVSYSWLVRILEGVLLYVVVQGREPIRPDRIPSVLVTNPAFFLSVDQADSVMYALASSLNLFTLWTLGLVALGLSVVGRLSRGGAFGLVGLLFGLWLALVVGWAAIF